MQAPENMTANLLLAGLSADDQSLLRPHLRRMPMERGMVMVARDMPIDHVWFPEGGVASITTDDPDHGKTEVAIFGRDGMSATALLLGAKTSQHDSFMQVDGTHGLRIDAEQLFAAVRTSATLYIRLLRFVQCQTVQTASSAASNAHQRIEARLGRWLLMCHDRVEGDEIQLTHEFMGMMISAERSSVTVSLHVLEGAGMIRARRSRVEILDRELLEELAGGSYGAAEREHRNLLGPFGKRSAGSRADGG